MQRLRILCSAGLWQLGKDVVAAHTMFCCALAWGEEL